VPGVMQREFPRALVLNPSGKTCVARAPPPFVGLTSLRPYRGTTRSVLMGLRTGYEAGEFIHPLFGACSCGCRARTP
jgi:hypothetical protein